MKVLHLIARMNLGGTSRYLTILSNGLEKAGIESAVVTGIVQGSETEDPSVSNINLHRIIYLGRAINPISDYKAFKRFQQFVVNERPDVIHTHTFKAGFIARIKRNALVESAGKEIKFVHTFHGHLLDDPEFSGIKKSVIILLERALAKKTDKIVTVGQKVASELLENRVGNLDQFVNIPPGVSPLSKMSKDLARKKLGLSHNAPIIGWLARVTGVKNPLLAAEIAKEIPNAKFIFGGDGDLMDQLKKSAPINTEIYGWVDAATFLSACDIILSTSENEGMPVALIEAQLAGIPVVATNVGSTAEVIINNLTGIITAKNKADLTNAIKSLIASPETLQKLGKDAISHANQTFAPSTMINKHIDLYNSL